MILPKLMMVKLRPRRYIMNNENVAIVLLQAFHTGSMFVLAIDDLTGATPISEKTKPHPTKDQKTNVRKTSIRNH